MHHKRSFVRVVALAALFGSAGIAYPGNAPQQSEDARKKTKKPSVYVQQRQTKETIELHQLEPIPGCKQVGVEVTSQGMVKKCFDNVPLWKD
jgi:hypothetical protein